MTLPTAGHASAERAAPAASSFVVAESAVRVFDTRVGGAPVPHRGTVTVDLSAHVPSGATAVVLNVTGVSLSESTFVTAWQADTTRPNASNINLRPAETRANTATVPVGPERRVSLYNHNGSTHLVADLLGHYGTTGGAWYNAVTPQRFLDTRATNRPFHGETARTVSLAGRVPAGTTAVVVNATAVAPTRDTFLSVTRQITGRPATSSLNVAAGETTPNLVTVPVSAELNIAVWNNSGTVDVVVDLVGYYSPDDGAAFHPMTATRVFDNRPARTVPRTEFWVRMRAVPAEATVVLANLTGISHQAPTFVAVWPAGQRYPGTSTLNLGNLQTAANHAVVPLGVDDAVAVYNYSGPASIIIDVSGYFAPRPA